MNEGEEINGFVVVKTTGLADGRTTAVELEHSATCARVLHLHNDDTENLFSITFPTPPPDDTGLPHILEHCVLSGSRRYPVRDPFFEMVKMSMATFINAMTAWDCTYYPVASNVKQDLMNLAEVYFDAVFHPLLTEQAFRREAHHLAPARPDDPSGDLLVNGIVFSEMRGAFSNPESRICRDVGRALFPDTVYGKESGGDPEFIPDLTYPVFRKYHQTYYHPSNAYFVFYGNIPTEEYLAFLEDRLAGFDRRKIFSSPGRQPRWAEPRFVEEAYPVGKNESLDGRTYIVMHWLCGDSTDPVETTLFNILSLILFGNEAAPLKKAIIDSGLGEDIFQSGDSSVGLETTFRVGIKGSEPDRCGAFVTLVLDVLRRIADSPIERERVDAAFQQAAYHHLEILPMYPLHVMRRVLSAWIYGAEPLAYVEMHRHLNACRAAYDDDGELFNGMIRDSLLDNPHRLTLVLRPDRGWQARNDRMWADRMKRVRAELTDGQLKEIAADAAELERQSGQPNSPEALAALPQLSVCDLPPEPRHIPTVVETSAHGVEILRNDVFANGVNYLHLDFNLLGLSPELWPYLARYSEWIDRLGAAGDDYEKIARRISSCTGGVSCMPVFYTHVSDPARPVWSMRFAVKALDEQMEPALMLLQDLFFGLEAGDKRRLRDLVIQARAWYRTNLVHDGSSTATGYAGRMLTPEGWLSEIVSGIPQLKLVDRFAGGFDETSDELVEKIGAVRDFLGVRDRLTASYTGSDRGYESVRKSISDWAGRMRGEPVVAAPTGFTAAEGSLREGLAGPVDINHCAQVLPAPHASDVMEPFVTLGARIVSLDYMLNEIRFKGNAYGAWFQYDPLGRVFHLGSYNDPHIVRTLSVFGGVLDYVRNADWSKEDIDRAIIGTAKHDERPIRPGSATGIALDRHLVGSTRERRSVRYAKVLSATPAGVKDALVAALESGVKCGAVCVVAAREKLEEANTRMPGAPLDIRDIL